MIKLYDVFSRNPDAFGTCTGRGTVSAYLIALLLVGMSFLLHLAIFPANDARHYLTYFPAVTLAAVAGGFGPGLLATFVSAILVTLSVHGFSFSQSHVLEGFGSNLVFATGSLITCYAIETMHRYRCKYTEKLEQAQQQAIRLRDLQQESERMLRRNQTLMMSVMDGIHIMDMDGQIVMVNDACCRILGYTREELVTLNVSEMGTQYPEEEWRKKFGDLMGRTDVIETRYQCKNGDLIDVELCLSGVLMDGQGLVYASVRDITARKQGEETQRVASVAFETNDAIMITDADGKIVRVNQAYSEITGFSAEEVAGKKPGELIGGQALECTERLRQAIRDGSWSGESYNARKNGEVYPVWMTVTAVKNQQQQITHCVSIFSDVTARKQLEEAKLRESNERFRGTLEQAAVGIVHTAMDGYLKQVNQKFCDIPMTWIEALMSYKNCVTAK
jgi:PAS domain S-box-containing protein